VAKLFSIGNTCLDIVLSHTDRLPKWNSELIFDETEWRLGGQATNFAIAAARLGLKPVLVSNVGSDDLGKGMRAELASVIRLDKRFFWRDACETGFTVAIIRVDGDRSFLGFLGHQKLFTMKRVAQKLPRFAVEGDMVHVSGLYLLPKLQRELPSLFKLLHRNGASISFDPGWRPGGFSKVDRRRFLRLLSLADFYEPNEAELKQVAGEKSMESAVERLGASFGGIIALKLGGKGSRVIEPSGKSTFAPAFPTRVDDTTGAGDVFNAGFMAGLIRHLRHRQCALLGNAAASIAISRRGKPSLRFPKLSEVEKLLHKP
jgi:sugar/nucleoside kinase (ribokinase family)